jgi:hypothetical protein
MPDAFRHVTESIAAEAASYSGAEPLQATSKPAPPIRVFCRRGIHARCLSPRDGEHRG